MNCILSIFAVLVFLAEGDALQQNSHKRVTLSRQHYLDKVAENAELLDEMKTLAGDFTLGPVGNLNINLVGTYMKCKEIGEIREKLAMGEEGALAEMIEAISTLVLFDIPGTVSPFLDAFNDILLDEGDEASTGVQKALDKTNKHIKKVLKSGTKPIKQRMDAISKGFHEMSDHVGKSIDDALDTLPTERATKLRNAGKAVNAFTGKGGEKLGAALTKVGGVMNVLSMTYSLYKIGEGAAKKDFDSVVEYGLVFAASVLAIVGTNAAIGSALGPIGIIAGVVVGSIAAIYGVLKPDPEGDLRADMLEARLISEKSIKYLHQDFELLPDVVSNIVGAGEFNDWLFESNQYILKKDIKGLTPNGPFQFSYKIADEPPFITDNRVCDDWNRIADEDKSKYPRIVDSGPCVPAGKKRRIDKTKYERWFNTLEGYENLKQPHDFYGFINNRKRYTGTTIMLRTNLLEETDAMRKINIDTKLPLNLWGMNNIVSHDDTLVLYDMTHLQSDSKVLINLRGGNDTVIINGRIGKSDAGQNILVDISFHDDSVPVGAKADFGGMLSFTGMNENKTLYDYGLKTNLTGIEYKPNAGANKRGVVCYNWVDGKQTCPIIISAVAIFGCSPLKDNIHLNSKHNMLIINDVGVNTYTFDITANYHIRAFQIADKSTQPATFNIKSPNVELTIVFIKHDGAYELYDEENRLKVRINYKASKNVPRIVLNGAEVDRNTFLRRRSELNKHIAARKPKFLNEYKYNGNVQIKKPNIQFDSKAQGVCLCPLTTQEMTGEGYWKIELTNKVDALVLTKIFFDKLEEQKLTAKLLYHKIDVVDEVPKYGWLFQIRKKTDFNNAEYPRYDIELKSVEVLKFHDNSVIFDLTDQRSLTNELNIVHRYKTITQYVFGSNCEEHADAHSRYGKDDYLVMKNQVSPGSSWNGDICDLGDGTNILVLDTTSMISGLKYQIVETEITFDKDDPDDVIDAALEVEAGEEDDVILLREIKIYNGNNHIKFHNIDRFVCQFEGGIQRDLPQFASGASTSGGTKRDLAEDCAVVRPTNEQYEGTRIQGYGYRGLHEYKMINVAHCQDKCQ